MKPQKCLSDTKVGGAVYFYGRLYRDYSRSFAIFAFYGYYYIQISLATLAELSNFAATSGSAKRENGDKNGFQRSPLETKETLWSMHYI